jgi:SAM-dependent methyltransferase
MCVDAIQFAEPPAAALAECARLLAPGGRLVLTCWEAREPADPQVPPRFRTLDLPGDLAAAGFASVRVIEKPDWRALERAMWQEAVATPASSDPAVISMQEEAGESWRRSPPCAVSSLQRSRPDQRQDETAPPARH